MIPIELKFLDARATMPRNAYGNDAGWDLFSIVDTEIPRGKPVDIRTGIAVALPEGYYGRIVHRSSTPRKRGLMVLEGIIDAGFRGELFACAYAWPDPFSLVGDLPITVRRGESIAQLIVQKVEPIRFEPVSELPPSERGEQGFGSSGP